MYEQFKYIMFTNIHIYIYHCLYTGRRSRGSACVPVIISFRCQFVDKRNQTSCSLPLHWKQRSSTTGWQRLIGSPKLQIIFHKRDTQYRSLLRKMPYKDKGSYGSSPPCSTWMEAIDLRQETWGKRLEAISVGDRHPKRRNDHWLVLDFVLGVRPGFPGFTQR